MSRLKTVGFEQATLATDSELFNVFGDPTIVTNIDPATGEVWNDQTATWNDPDAPWNPTDFVGAFDPDGVRSGNYGLQLSIGNFISIKASTKGGGGYLRVYVKLKQAPDDTTSVMCFARDSDSLDMATVEVNPDLTLALYYRNDAGVKTYVGSVSNALNLHQWYAIELGVIGAETGTNRTFEARLDHLRFAQGTTTSQASYDGFLVVGPNFASENGASVFSYYADDIASNDGYLFPHDDQNTWCGPGKIVIIPVSGDDSEVGNHGWTRGGADSGSDWGQVADCSPPNDATNYLVGGNDAEQVDFRLANPYERGIRPEDTIKVVVANIRWSMQDESEGASVYVYLRAGSNLDHDGTVIDLFGTDWFTGDAAGQSPDVFSTTVLPQDPDRRWTVEELAAGRIGMEVVDSTPDIYVTSMWALVEYNPYDKQTEYLVMIDGEDRTDDVRFQTLKIEDILYNQANTASFQMYDLHDRGRPTRGLDIEIYLNDVKLFGGLTTKVAMQQLSNNRDLYTVNCVDWTRILDRRMVSATYTNMTDKEIIQAIIDQYCGDEDITTYHVAEGVLVNQISFNYISVSKALDQIAKLTGRSWYIDYDKDLHYFPLTQARAPFEITSDGNQHTNFQLVEDDNQLRNRVFVRGGTELTTEPITETIVADGEQRQFLLAEKPHDLAVTVNGVAKTIGIKNIDDPTLFDFLVNFQQKYVECGDAFTTPAASDLVAVSYNYDVPVLVAVEDTNSIEAEALKSGGSGIYEYAIIDKNIASTQQARDRAAAELTDYANGLTEGGYSTMEKGLRSGMYQRITMSNKDQDADYIINKVTFQSLGGGLFTYSVQLSSAKTLGIIRFLIEMLQINRTVGEFDPNEKVDQFFNLTDMIDSFTDSLTIDSQGLGFPWAVDSPPPTGKHLRWNLGQWR